MEHRRLPPLSQLSDAGLSTPFFSCITVQPQVGHFGTRCLTNRWFGRYIKNYREGRGLPRREKALTLIALWLTIGLTSVFAISIWWVRLILLGIALGVTTHVLRIKTYHAPDGNQPASEAK